MFNLISFHNDENKIIYTIEETKNLILLNFYKNGKYIVPRKSKKNVDIVLLKSIYEHTKKYKKFTLLIRCKFICGEISENELECKSCKREVLLYGYTLGKYCGDKKCLKNIFSIEAKKRGTWMMHTSDARQRKIKSLTGRKLSEENKRRIGESNSKKWTPEFREWDRRNRIKLNVNQKISNTMKAKILSGELTPKSENRKRSKRLYSEITKINYRSNWELIFHEKNLNLQYEAIRINYIDNGELRVYITDFVDFEKKIIYEIKPTSELNSLNFKNKKEYTERWCIDNGFTYKVVTELDYNFYGRNETKLK